jgi:hypothetical protein|tara:strand:+ start:414 stop:593 length:180 start_codon:yes stop_codon:yes gene_type:complete
MKQRYFGMLDHQIVSLGKHENVDKARSLGRTKYRLIYLIFDEQQMWIFKKQLDSLMKGK